MKYSTWEFIANQRKTVPPAPVADLTGKTILITGANTGLGYEAAKHFANMKPGKVIIACRSKSKGDEAVARKFCIISTQPRPVILTIIIIGRSTEGDRLFQYSVAVVGLGKLCFHH
jgi:NADPH:quinone reductase-like Zn-dependent oxidoreductase